MRFKGFYLILILSFLFACQLENSELTDQNNPPVDDQPAKWDVNEIAQAQLINMNGWDPSVERITCYEFPSLDIDVTVINFLLQGNPGRSICYAAYSEQVPTLIYDTGMVMQECASPGSEIRNVSILPISGRVLLVLEISSFSLTCCGGSTRQRMEAVFLNKENDFTLALKLETSFADFADDYCDAPGVPVQRSGVFFPNGNSNYLSFLQTSSSGTGSLQAFKWDSDSTKLVEF